MNRRTEEAEKLHSVFNCFIRPKLHAVILIMFIVAIGVAVGNTAPYIYGKMIDGVSSSDILAVKRLIIIYMVISVFTQVLSVLETYLGELISFKLTASIKEELYRKVIYARCNDYYQYTVGEIQSRLNGDADAVVTFYMNVLTGFGQIIINLLVSFYFILMISIKLSAVALFYVPATFIVSCAARRFYKVQAEKRRLLDDRNYSFTNESVRNQNGIKAFCVENAMISKFRDIISEQFVLKKKSVIFGSMFSVCSSFITLSASMYIIYTSALLIKAGLMSLGTMVSFNTYIQMFFSALSKVWGVSIDRQTVLVSAVRLHSLLSAKDENGKGIDIPSDVLPSITFNNVCFSYPGTTKVVLDNLSFTINEPGLYGFVGPNGCGKSTLAKLLVRFYEPDSGSIEAFGNDIRAFNHVELRKNILLISGKDLFFKDSITNNVAFYRTKINSLDIQNVCKMTGISEYIDTLPAKYDTLIGESGVTLSDGQKQKLNISRALLSDAKIIIFDETTSNIDWHSEKEINALLKDLSKNKIVIVVTHRKSSLVENEKIFVIKNGCVAASGRGCNLADMLPEYGEQLIIKE